MHVVVLERSRNPQLASQHQSIGAQQKSNQPGAGVHSALKARAAASWHAASTRLKFSCAPRDAAHELRHRVAHLGVKKLRAPAGLDRVKLAFRSSLVVRDMHRAGVGRLLSRDKLRR